MAKPKIPLADRFWAKVLKTESCWLWQAQTNNKGYGVFMYYSKTLRRASRQMYAHRCAWTLTKGDIPEGLRVLHRCDNPPCCNPDHLFLGTQRDNMRDCAAKGRQRTVNPFQKGHPILGRAGCELTDEQVRAIRIDRRPDAVIGAEVGLHRVSIWKIKTGRSWRHLP